MGSNGMVCQNGHGGETEWTASSHSQFSMTQKGPGDSVVQCLARDLKVASSNLAHGSFLVRGVVLSLTLAELYDL